jgi:hypothetical protein
MNNCNALRPDSGASSRGIAIGPPLASGSLTEHDGRPHRTRRRRRPRGEAVAKGISMHCHVAHLDGRFAGLVCTNSLREAK